ncbi:MAG: hypothetical protein J5663_08365 [Bacteroidaceae bacterium]|nr:hypothetical protein [Bacteroidaceae bacterium]
MMFALMCGCIISTSFVACGDDDDDRPSSEQENQPESQPESQSTGQEEGVGKLVSATIDYKAEIYGFNVLKAMSSNGKVMVKYIDSDGTTKTEEMTSDSITKPVSFIRSAQGNIIMGMNVYVEAIDSTKVMDYIGTAEIGAKIISPATIKHQNDSYTKRFSHGICWSAFDRGNQQALGRSAKSFMTDYKQLRQKYGVVSIACFSVEVNDSTIDYTDKWAF